MIHRLPREGIAVELEPVAPDPAGRSAAEVARQVSQLLTDGIAAISVAPSHTALYGEVVRVMRALCGYDRVMVYKFDPEGHGEIVGEARLDDLEPFLGLHYPSSDIPHQARELYLRNRVRVLVDVSYQPAQLFPRLVARSPARKWTCRCPRSAACRRCTCSTCRTWVCAPRWSRRSPSATGSGA